MNGDWIHKIKNVEINPPGHIWGRICDALESGFTEKDFAERIYHYEVTPPQNVWNKIRHSIDPEGIAAVPVARAKRIQLLRYIAAACFLAFIAFGTLRLINRTHNRTDLAKTVYQEPEKTGITTAGPGPQLSHPGTNATTQQEKDDAALEESKHTFARLDWLSRRHNNSTTFSLYSSPAQLVAPSDDDPANYKKAEPEIQYSHRAAVSDLNDKKDAERYLMFKDEDGRFIRISKKLTDLLCCVSGEQQDEQCTDQLKQWREKIASSSFIPSPDNFMGILDLVKSLQDTRN